MKKISIAIICLLLSAACAPLGKYVADNDVSDTLYGDVTVNADTTSNIALLNWREFFTDPILQDLIQKALENNKDLMMARERVVQAEAVLLSSKMAYTPALALSPDGGYTYLKSPEGGIAQWNYNLAATASWEIDLFGRIANNIKSSKASLAQMQDYEQAARANLIATLANTYFTMLMLDKQLETSIEMENVWEQTLHAIRVMKDDGFADQVAVSQYEATYDGIKITILDIKNNLVTAENAMDVLLGEPCPSLLRGKLDEQVMPEELSIGIPVQLLANRADVRAAQREVEKAFYTTKAAWLNFFPSLTINGTAGLTNLLNGVVSPLSTLANLSAGLVAPVFNRGLNRAQLKIAESRQREAKYALDNILLVAGREVNDALAEYKSYKEREIYYNDQVENLSRARHDTELLTRNSEGKTYLDVLAAHNALIDAEFSQIANTALKLQAAVDLYQALGGGSE